MSFLSQIKKILLLRRLFVDEVMLACGGEVAGAEPSHLIKHSSPRQTLNPKTSDLENISILLSSSTEIFPEYSRLGEHDSVEAMEDGMISVHHRNWKQDETTPAN